MHKHSNIQYLKLISYNSLPIGTRLKFDFSIGAYPKKVFSQTLKLKN